MEREERGTHAVGANPTAARAHRSSFLLTHVILIAGGILIQTPQIPAVLRNTGTGFDQGLATLGAGGLCMLFLHAYSLGGGTYTGIEAASNGLSIMREPRVQTGKRTMFYMALSLAFTASGRLLCDLLRNASWVPGKTRNAVLADRFVGSIPLGGAFVILLLLSEGVILIVAAQAGFVDGPRVLANMAVDSWVPRRFAALSERLTTQNGILLMGAAALGALLYTGGPVRHIVVVYSINVFLTGASASTPSRARSGISPTISRGRSFCRSASSTPASSKAGHGRAAETEPAERARLQRAGRMVVVPAKVT